MTETLEALKNATIANDIIKLPDNIFFPFSPESMCLRSERAHTPIACPSAYAHACSCRVTKLFVRVAYREILDVVNSIMANAVLKAVLLTGTPGTGKSA